MRVWNIMRVCSCVKVKQLSLFQKLFLKCDVVTVAESDPGLKQLPYLSLPVKTRTSEHLIVTHVYHF